MQFSVTTNVIWQDLCQGGPGTAGMQAAMAGRGAILPQGPGLK
jgi:hypothetical protein